MYLFLPPPCDNWWHSLLCVVFDLEGVSGWRSAQVGVLGSLVDYGMTGVGEGGDRGGYELLASWLCALLSRLGGALAERVRIFVEGPRQPPTQLVSSLTLESVRLVSRVLSSVKLVDLMTIMAVFEDSGVYSAFVRFGDRLMATLTKRELLYDLASLRRLRREVVDGVETWLTSRGTRLTSEQVLEWAPEEWEWLSFVERVQRGVE